MDKIEFDGGGIEVVRGSKSLDNEILIQFNGSYQLPIKKLKEILRTIDKVSDGLVY